MKYSITIEAYDTHIYVNFNGSLSVSNVMGVQQFLMLDPNYKSVLRALFDFRDMYIDDESAGTEVMKFAMKTLENRPIDDPSKIAFLASDNQIFQLAETFKNILKDSPIRIDSFDSEREAVRWLRV